MRILSYTEASAFAPPSCVGHMIECDVCGHSFKINLANMPPVKESTRVQCPKCLTLEHPGPMLDEWRKKLTERKP